MCACPEKSSCQALPGEWPSPGKLLFKTMLPTVVQPGLASLTVVPNKEHGVRTGWEEPVHVSPVAPGRKGALARTSTMSPVPGQSVPIKEWLFGVP